jgi:rRNA-processing protein FCF1
MIEDRTSHRQPAKIILDSNILLLSQKFKIDIFEELKTILNKRFELVLLSPIQQELLTLAEKGSPKMRMNASFALELTRKCKLVKLDECFESPDDAIVETAQEWKCAVFTNDRQLKKRLRNINVPVIYVRQKSRLEIDGRL